MIRYLSVRHLAVIDTLTLECEPGLTVLTGETGAGKSILVEALGLLVGGRASGDLVRTGEDTATVEGIFETPEGREIVVRREISAQGRSRAFIDDTLVTTAALKELGTGLVDFHGQHEHQALLDPRTQLDLLDAFGQLDSARAEVARWYGEWRRLENETARLRQLAQDRAARAELVRFQLAEIDRVRPRPDEDAALEAERQVLANVERVDRLCEEAYSELYEGDRAVLSQLAGIWRNVAELAAIERRFTPHLEAREAVTAQLEDLAFFLRTYRSSLDRAPGRLQDVETRLAELDRLKRKYGPTLADVLGREARLRAELDELAEDPDRLAALERVREAARAAFLEAATSLSQARRDAAAALARRLEAALAELAMEKTRCEIRFPDEMPSEAEWTDRGIDRIEFFLSPNPGEDLRPLARIVSGGELSRVMLAIKTLVTTDVPGKTLVFDEVDAGIGGRVAEIVGARLRRLSERFQVFCITHLPQIAAWGHVHYLISKTAERGRTVTRAARVDGEARVEELARLMAGGRVSDRVRASARELLRLPERREENTKGPRVDVRAR